jgi:hypothetical protein
MSGSRPGSYRGADQRSRPAASTETATYDVVPMSRVSPRIVPGPAYGTRTAPRRGPGGHASPQANQQASQQSRLDPRRFAGQLKRVVVAGSVIGFGLFFALVAEHVVGVTSGRGGTPAPGSPSQASSPYDGFFGPSTQSQSGGLNLGGIFGGSGGAGSGGSTGSGGSGGVSAGSGLVNGGGGAPMMISSGS